MADVVAAEGDRGAEGAPSGLRMAEAAAGRGGGQEAAVLLLLRPQLPAPALAPTPTPREPPMHTPALSLSSPTTASTQSQVQLHSLHNSSTSQPTKPLITTTIASTTTPISLDGPQNRSMFLMRKHHSAAGSDYVQL